MRKKLQLPQRISHKLTTWEWEGLRQGYNIADGHARQAQSTEYKKIIDKLSRLYLTAEKQNQLVIQHKFEEAFFKIAGQTTYKKLHAPLYQAACSLSIEVVANYLRQTKKSVALLHPTFDNLADILKRHDIPMKALEEQAILEPEKNLQYLQADALFLVCPNNPTGTELTSEQFIAIVTFCKKYKKLLILDFSFRFYSSYTTWDQYALLQSAGIDFILLEDTGKTWSTLELKIGITVASDTIYPYLADITSDFLLNVSPFIFLLLTEYIQVELKKKKYYNAARIVANHRLSLQKQLKNLPLELVNPSSKLSVAWIKLPPHWRATAFCKWVSSYGVHVLPGGPFFWNDHDQGEGYFRIALLRPEEVFLKALRRLRQATQAYSPDN